MRKNILAILIVFLFVIIYFMQPNKKPMKYNEKYYQTKMCNDLDGLIEYRLSDKTRVDCLTDDYAIEVDWAKKWAESIGQSLYYAQMTNRKPAVGLIIGIKDDKFMKRLKLVADKFDIKIIKLKVENEY